MASRTVSNTGGNWNATATWVGGVVPIAGDTVDFTALSGPLVVNVITALLAGIDFTNYVNTITFNNIIQLNTSLNLGTGGYTQAGTSGLYINNNTTISGTTTWTRGFLIAANAAVTLTLSNNLNLTDLSLNGNAASLSFILGGNVVSISNNITFIGNGTYTLNLPHDLQITNLIIGAVNSRTCIINGLFTLSISGNLTQSQLATTTSGTASILLNGTGTWSNASTGALRNNLTIDTAGTITIIGTVYYNTGILTYTSGTVITTGSTLAIATTGTLNCGNMNDIITNKWDNIVFFSGTYVLTSNLNCQNFTAGGGAVTINNSGGDIFISGNLLHNTGGGILGTASINLIGTGTWTDTAANSIRNNLNINTTGVITIVGNIYYTTGILTYTAGTVDTTTNNSTLNIGASTTLNTDGINWNNVAITTGTISLTSNFVMSNLLTIGTTSNQTITFSGVGVLSPTITCNLLVSTNSINTTLNLPHSITVNNFTYSVSPLGSTGFFILNNNTINILGNLSLIQSAPNIGGGIIGNGSLAMIGTGTWSSTYQPFQSSGTWYNYIAVNIIFNTTGVITITNSVAFGFRNDGIVTTKTITYISGEINATSSILWILDSAIQSGIVFNTNTLMWGSIYIARNVGASSSYNNITLLSDLNISGTLYFFDGSFSNSLGFIVNGGYNINMASLVVSHGGGVLTGTATFVFNKTGTWIHGTGISVSNNITINTSDTLTISGNVYYNSRTITYINGKVITKNSTLNLTAASTLINCHKINFYKVIATGTITMNEFFSGSPNLVTDISGAYTIAFQDNFEKITKFVNIKNCTLSRPLQLLVITNSPRSSTNTRGIRYINQNPNGIAKGNPSINAPMTFGVGGLIGDPNM